MPTDPMHSDSNRRTDAPAHRHHPRQAGVILVFVVVFLVLLAIIGAAFVASARIDRMQVGNLAGRAVERDPNIRDIFDQSVEAVLRKLEQDDTPFADGFDDPFMSALMPRLLSDPNAGGTVDSRMAVWPKISLPIGDGFTEDFFIQSPKDYNDSTTGFSFWGGGGSGVSDEGRFVAVGDVSMEWRDGTDSPRRRTFPGLRPYDTTLAAPEFVGRNVISAAPLHLGAYFAGDADGDGIADTGMSVFIADDSITAVNDRRRYVRNGVFYTIGYRVVDKNGQINVNTAGSRDGILASDGGTVTNLEALSIADDGSIATATNVFGPTLVEPERYGFFRHGIGLFELFEFAGYNAAVLTNGFDAFHASTAEFHNVSRSRLGLDNEQNGFTMTAGQLWAKPLDAYNYTIAGTPVYAESGDENRDDFRYRGVGDLAEQQLARRILFPGVMFEVPDWDTGANTDGVEASAYAEGDADGLSFRGGLQPKFADSDVAGDLDYTVTWPDINNSQGRGPNDVQPFSYQPYASMRPTSGGNANLRRLTQFDPVANVPFTAGRLFDPNVFPANEHDVWSGGALAMMDDPDFVLNATLTGQTHNAFTWRLTDGASGGALVNGNFNGADGDASINGEAGGPDFGYYRPLRRLLTTVNGVSPRVPTVTLYGIADDTTAGNVAATYGGNNLRQALARTYRLLEWTQDPVFLSNGDIGSTDDDVLPVAATANTSSVRELFRAYYHVLADPNASLTHAGANLPLPRGYQGTLNGGIDVLTGSESTYFRNVLRYSAAAADEPGLSASQVMILRAAILAVNTKDLRDSDDDVSVFVVDLGPQAQDGDNDGLYGEDDTGGGSAETTPFETAATENVTAVVYGVERQPYITELMVWNDTTGTGPGSTYVAIEIYNPHEDPIDLTGWHLAGFTRDATAGTEERTEPAAANQIIDLGAAVATIPAGGYVVLASAADDPVVSGLITPTAVDANLAQLVPPPPAGATELYLMRPAASGAAPAAVQLVGEDQRTTVNTGATLTQLGYTEGAAPANIGNLIPVDQVDLTGMDAEDVRFWYTRSTAPWEFVYPGRYDTNDIPAVAGGSPNPGPLNVFVNGTAAAPAVPTSEYRSTELDGVPQADVWVQDMLDTNGIYRDYTDPGYLGAINPTFGADNDAAELSVEVAIGFVRPAVQVQNFRNAAALGTTDDTVSGPDDRFFPFGMFGRDADLLQATMFGSYKLVQSPTVANILAENGAAIEAAITGTAAGERILELNSTTADLALMMAPDPVTPIDVDGDTSTADIAPGYSDNPGRFDLANNSVVYDIDQWGTSVLFEYIQAHQGAASDYFPMVRPEEWGPLTAALGGASPYDFNLALGPGTGAGQMSVAQFQVAPKPVDNDGNNRRFGGIADANTGTELALPIQGRININTAPAEVLAMLPLVLNDDGTVNEVATRQLAYNIANYRDGLRPASYSGAAQQVAPAGEFVDRLPVGTAPDGTIDQFGSVIDILDADDSISSAAGGFAFADFVDLGRFNDENERLARGNFTPFVPGSSGTGAAQSGSATDFEIKAAGLSRISNLITTRSDSYDVYVVVQAWRLGVDPAGNDDSNYTRLIDERRGQFRVSRDRIDGGYIVERFDVAPKD